MLADLLSECFATDYEETWERERTAMRRDAERLVFPPEIKDFWRRPKLAVRVCGLERRLRLSNVHESGALVQPTRTQSVLGTPVRAFAVQLHATGCSFRETKQILRYIGVEYFHQAVW
ncbi:putative transposase [Haloferax mediterranei ATCC 33500]|uniref:Transposase n=1 Tax=Haloferax mediterranei (strain ATCC 33500 / DSM 1411 / JCM 8866 / NBRC 14739 / NCIMB 2177 / R-4) TaxID=523841 RepID=I3R9W0_HALMT|nr:transposase [Haloferax mediterranei ATCC 33500]EMA05194.1 putative transposase [Haloferax mediterranei ATCC 33500]